MDTKEREERIEGLKECCSNMLRLMGEDVEREGLVKTPERVARAILDTTAGYGEDPEAILRGAMFKEDYSQMVIVKDIDFYSLCEHHILPFFGKVHVAYIPNGYITGLSKIRSLLPPSAGSGKDDPADKGVYSEDPQSIGRNGGCRGAAPVYANAWSEETELRYHNIRLLRCFQSGKDP